MRTISCPHPHVVIIAGSSIERYANKVTLVDLHNKKIKKLPDLDFGFKNFSMTYHDTTGVLTLVGGSRNDLVGKKANRTVYQLPMYDKTPNWREMTTDLTYDVDNPLLVNDDEYLYVCPGWQRMCNL